MRVDSESFIVICRVGVFHVGDPATKTAIGSRSEAMQRSFIIIREIQTCTFFNIEIRKVGKPDVGPFRHPKWRTPPILPRAQFLQAPECQCPEWGGGREREREREESYLLHSPVSTDK